MSDTKTKTVPTYLQKRTKLITPDGQNHDVDGVLKEKTDGSVEITDQKIERKELEVSPAKPEVKLCLSCKKPRKAKDDPTFDPATDCNHGRPTKYTEELLAKCYEYLELKMPNKETDEVVHSIFGLCDYPGVDITTETAYQWVKDPDKEAFSDIVMRIMRKQGKTLIAGGLSETFSGQITKLLLSKHGYRDSVDKFNHDVPVDPALKEAGDKAVDDFLLSSGEQKK